MTRKIGDVEIKVVFKGETFKWEDDRNTYAVTIKKDNQKYTFKFYDSIHNTQNNIILTDRTFNSIVECICTDYLITSENYPTLESFCREFGYEEWKSESKKTYRECIKHGDKLSDIIDQDWVESVELAEYLTS